MMATTMSPPAEASASDAASATTTTTIRTATATAPAAATAATTVNANADFVIPHSAIQPIVSKYIEHRYCRGINEIPVANGATARRNPLTPLMEAASKGDETGVFILLHWHKLAVSAADVDSSSSSNNNVNEEVVVTQRDQIRQQQQQGQEQQEEQPRQTAAPPAAVAPAIARVDMQAQDNIGYTALHYAVLKANKSICRLLIQHIDRVDIVNIEDGDLRTPLHVASLREMSPTDRYSIMKTLLENGANPNIQDCAGESPLHLLSWGRCDEIDVVDICRMLVVDYGADVNLQDYYEAEEEKTPMAVAARRGWDNLVQLFLPTATITTRLNALKAASKKGHVVVAQTLVDSISFEPESPQGSSSDDDDDNDRVQQIVDSSSFESESPQGSSSDDDDDLDRVQEIVDSSSFESESQHTSSSDDDDDHNPLQAIYKLLGECCVWLVEEHRHDDPTIRLQCESLVMFLLNNGAQYCHVNTINNNIGQRTILHSAAKHNMVQILKLVLDTNTEIDINEKDYSGSSPLLLTMEYASRTTDINKFRSALDTIKMMIVDYDADVNTTDNDGVTPLHVVGNWCGYRVKGQVSKQTLEQSVEVLDTFAKLLIEKGADVNAKSARGITPLHSACIRLPCDVVWSTREHPYPLHIQTLLEAGANVNDVDNYSRTPLFCTAHSFSVCTAKLLLDHGADVHMKNSDGRTPLAMAVRSGKSIEMVQLLLNNGADVEINLLDDENGYAPLHHAVVKNSNADFVQLLLDDRYGADVDIRTSQHYGGNTALHRAADYGNYAIVKILLDNDADATLRNADGQTPLDFAYMRHGDRDHESGTETIKLLLEHQQQKQKQEQQESCKRRKL